MSRACNIFPQRNPNVVKELGDVGNDLQVYGERLYAVINCSNLIEIMELSTAKHIGTVSIANCRYITFDKGYAYVSSYAGPVQVDPNARPGKIVKIDTATLSIVGECIVGYQPEEMAVVDNKLYVANSGGLDYNTALGYDNTVSVIDISTFSQVAKVEVTCNPAVVVAAGNEVYVASYGNYNDVPSTLQRISPDGGVSVVEECSNMTEICYNSGRLYGFFSSYDANWNATITYQSYDVADKSVDTPWIKESFLPTPYKVCAAGEYVCVTSSDYINDGDTYLYDTDGMLVHTIPSGLNPVKAVVIE